MDARLVVAGGALGLGMVQGVAHCHEGERFHLSGAAEGDLHRRDAVGFGRNAEPNCAKAYAASSRMFSTAALISSGVQRGKRSPSVRVHTAMTHGASFAGAA